MSENETIWEATLDGVYECRVERLSRDVGRLTMRQGDNDLLDKEVALSWGAAFGPDVGDVADWQTICAEAADAL